ncbi:LysR family transcriptional regulator [Alicyclobacillus curvatus]|nr:LysR family transcriptional regulator [Alicyclobacillus curvatus]
MTLTQLQIFLTLIQTGSFTKAGEVLGMSQSAVSHAIASLESEFGVPLIVRERRSALVLTSAGEHLTVHVREIMHRVGLIMEEVSSVNGIETGTIRIGTSQGASLQALPPMLAAFRQQHPNIEIIFVEGTTQEVLDWASTRTVDVGLVISSEPPQNAMPLLTAPLVAVIPSTFPGVDSANIPMNTISDTPFVLTKSDHGTLVQQLLIQQGINLRVLYEVSDLLAALRLVEEGIAVTVIPESFSAAVDLSNVHVHRVEPPIAVTLYLIAPSLDEASPVVRAFIEMAQVVYPRS